MRRFIVNVICILGFVIGLVIGLPWTLSFTPPQQVSQPLNLDINFQQVLAVLIFAFYIMAITTVWLLNNSIIIEDMPRVQN
jgi:ABC-type lipoprotein release transport system permease subunit